MALSGAYSAQALNQTHVQCRLLALGSHHSLWPLSLWIKAYTATEQGLLEKVTLLEWHLFCLPWNYSLCRWPEGNISTMNFLWVMLLCREVLGAPTTASCSSSQSPGRVDLHTRRAGRPPAHPGVQTHDDLLKSPNTRGNCWEGEVRPGASGALETSLLRRGEGVSQGDRS